MGTGTYLELTGLTKAFGGVPALADFSLAVTRGERVCLLGPSGCGKSTLLRLVAGLEEPDAGTVVLDGQSLAGVPVHARGVGLMFQDYALFPHLSARDNVAFGLHMQGMARAAAQGEADAWLARVGLAGFGARRVDMLSGGERQRVALARSLAPRPRVLLLDEPLGALDRALRERLLEELPPLLAELQQTVLYVTHDQAEAFALGERVALLNGGRLVQCDTPSALYNAPRSAFAARFLGLTNLIAARVVGPGIPDTPDTAGRAAAGDAMAECGLGRVAAHGVAPLSGAGTLLIRPEAARIVAEGADAPDTAGWAPARAWRLVRRTFRGRFVQITVVLEEGAGAPLIFEIAATERLPEDGARVWLSLSEAGVQWLEDA